MLKQLNPRSILAIAGLGSGLEMYDFVVYVFFAPEIASTFFPKGNHFAALLLTFSVFAIGYFARTLGALLFGHYADSHGRKNTLFYTITLMALPTVLITILPGYQTIGIAAPLILTVLRCLQGLAVGGEFSGAITLVSEIAPKAKQGLYCAGVILALNLGILITSLLSAGIKYIFFTQLHWQGAWRIAFLLGFILLLVAGYIRKSCIESPVFEKLLAAKQHTYSPITHLIKNHWHKLLSNIFISFSAAMSVGMLLFIPTYLHNFTYVASHNILVLNSIALAALCIMIPIAAHLSDRYGRRLVMGSGIALMIILTHPIGVLLSTTTNITYMIIGLIVLMLPNAIILGTFGAFLSANFAPEVRATGVGLSYNIPFTLITGTFPALSLFIIHTSSHIGFQHTYVAVLCLFALSHLLTYPAKSSTTDSTIA